MPWLWYVGPLAAIALYALIAFWPTRRQNWRGIQLQRWVEEFLGPLTKVETKFRADQGYRGSSSKKVKTLNKSRRLRRLPPSAELMAEAAGAGSSLGDIVLVPKLAYLTLRSAGWNRVK